MRKIAICDSSTQSLDLISGVLAAQYEKELQISTYPSGLKLLKAWQKDERKKTDIIVMEIDSEPDSGIGVARQICELFGEVKMIFSTAALECAEDIFDTEPVCLLTRPVKPEKLCEAMQRALQLIQDTEDSFVTLISKSFIARVRAEDILYVESERRILTVHCSEEDIRVNMKLGDLEKRLPAYFVRVHQSYLVNMKQIQFFSAKGARLADGRTIPVSRPRYAKTKTAFLQFLGEKEE
ncbi:MAG: LytTR family DNA-binding domain-containing protein [Eubacteriales bacterium]|nr:LytTR family DNA-binding domain-containing protein [Eubacteriales bacterium]